MEKVEYPKFLYKEGDSKLVQTAEEHKALGEGWAESPDEVTAEKPKKGRKAD